MDIVAQLDKACTASRKTALLSAEAKNRALLSIAKSLRKNSDSILEENKKDIKNAEENKLGRLVDRLLLTPERIDGIARETEKVAELPDSTGTMIIETRHSNGMTIRKMRVPLGVVAMIYESRPNVTVDAAVLALKSGNAIVLKGGKEAENSNRALVRCMRESLRESGIDPETIQFLDGATREDTRILMEARGKVDLLIPRGGANLIRFVRDHSRVPVIETGASVVHTFIDASADMRKAVEVVVNEKTRRVSVCNAVDTILIHEAIAEEFLQKLVTGIKKSSSDKNHSSVILHADKKCFFLLSQCGYEALVPAKADDYDHEWLDYEMSVKIVADLDDALEHIRLHSLGHSESIITEDRANAECFLLEVDAACVYHNVSTAFSDGAEFGLGTEIGISTQKMHARGPFALEALTTTKWIIEGNGQTRPA